MTTYERWLQKFNEGGHPPFEQFICDQLDEVKHELNEEGLVFPSDVDEATKADIDKSMRDSMLGKDEEPAPVTPNNAGDAGGSSDS